MSFKLPGGERGRSFRGGISKQTSFLSSASNFLSNSILNAGQAIKENEVLHIFLALIRTHSLTHSLTRFIIQDEDNSDEVIGELEKSIKGNKSYEVITTYETEADQYEYCYPGFSITPVTSAVRAAPLVTTDPVDNLSHSVGNASNDDDGSIDNTIVDDDSLSLADTHSLVSVTKVPILLLYYSFSCTYSLTLNAG